MSVGHRSRGWLCRIRGMRGRAPAPSPKMPPRGCTNFPRAGGAPSKPAGSIQTGRSHIKRFGVHSQPLLLEL